MAQSIDGKLFLLIKNGDGNKIIFATDDNLKLLSEAETLFIDGTFHKCPEIIFIRSSAIWKRLLEKPIQMVESFKKGASLNWGFLVQFAAGAAP